MSTVKYTAGSLMLWADVSAGGPGRLVQMHDIMDSVKYQQIKNEKQAVHDINHIIGRGWVC